MNKKTFCAIAILMASAILAGSEAVAQKKTSFLQLFGNVQSKGKNLAGAIIQVYEGNTLISTSNSKDNGSFVSVMDLNKNLIVVFSKPGFVAKSIEVKTIVPPEAYDIGYTFKCNVDLFEDIGGLSTTDPMQKPVAKIAYSSTYEDFDFDANYTRRIQQEQLLANKEAEDLKRAQEKLRLDSLNKAWNDSIKLAESSASKLAAEKLQLEQARRDSITAAQAKAAAYAAAEKVRLDSLAKAEVERKRLEEIARERARQDSLAKAEAELKRKHEEEKERLALEAREKARQDSISRAEAEARRRAESERQKQIADSTAKANEILLAQKKATADSLARVKADEQRRIKAREDSIFAADQAFKARQKFMADSTALAHAREKVRQDSITNAEQEAKRLADAARQKAFDDSLSAARAHGLAIQKAKADSLKNAEAAEKARKDSMAAVEKELLLKAEQKRRQEIQDSIANAAAAEKLRAKQREDSIAAANAEALERAKQAAAAAAKVKEDSLMAAKLKSEKENAVRDSIAAAERNLQLILAAEKDSIAKAEQEAKLAALQAEKEKADREKLLRDAENKRIQDSLASVARAQKEKEEAERQAQIKADIQAKKDMLAAANKIDTTKQYSTEKPSTSVPKIKDSDYQEGITDETVTESNRTINRTVVKIKGVTNNYQKISYNWGGVYYFKNETSITLSTFNLEISNARKELGK